VTTTSLRLHPENETRVLSLTITDTSDQTKSVLRALAQDAAPFDINLDRWHVAARLFLAVRTTRICQRVTAPHLANSDWGA
jgi:hypothetical protein